MANVEVKTYTGQCLCGSVTFTARGLSDIWYCHCKQCQHLTGLYIAAAGCAREDVTIFGEVNWLPISESSNSDYCKSGHCKSCGAYMFWDDSKRPTLSILAGNIDDTTGLEALGHIFTKDKSSYYVITDGLPQYAAYPPNGTRQEGVK